MKKGVLSVLLFLLIVPITFADITIQTEQNIYNLGNKIKASASVLQSNNFEGLFKLTISCGNYKYEYLSAEISLEANFRRAVNPLDDPRVTSEMLGNCTIIGDLLTKDKIVIEEKNSNNFGVTNQLIVLPVNSKIKALPADSIQIAGIINEAFGSNVLKASTKVVLDNNSYSIDAIDGKFNITLKIPSTIKSGKHNVEISASDSKNNLGSSSIGLEITAVPTYIKLDLSNNQILPGSKIDITSSLYDQADELINDSLDLELTAPNGNKVFRKLVRSNEETGYEFSQYAEPGLYTLISTYKNLLAQASINITTIREVKIKYGNETVMVENIGNIPFEDELTFILESELKKYPITKKIKVEPGKFLSIDLSKEVPLGIYNIILPVKEGLEPVKEKINETLQSVIESAREGLGSLVPEKEKVLASDVTIHDNRPAYKKIAGGLSLISGAITGADGVLARNPLIAPMVLIVVLLLLIFRYGRKPLMRLLKRKKDDES